MEAPGSQARKAIRQHRPGCEPAVRERLGPEASGWGPAVQPVLFTAAASLCLSGLVSGREAVELAPWPLGWQED